MHLFMLSILQMFLVNEAFNLSCPTQAHWNLRAKSMCIPTRNYTCLYDVTFQVNVYRDRCSRPRILAPGYKYVFQPNLNRATCRESRYQPFIFDTIGYSDCTFLKSLCNSEGQTRYRNGNTTSDRTCICNTDQGYSFVEYSKHPSYCIPSTEDCSCYIGINLTKNTTRLKDFKCYGEVHVNLNSRRSEGKLCYKTETTKINIIDNYKYNIVPPTTENRTTVAVIVLISVLSYSLVAVLINIFQKRLQQNHRNEIDSGNYVEETFQNRQDTLEDNKQKLEETKRLETEDPVPTHIRGQMKLKIDGWRVKDKKFICTKACNYVYDKIRSKSCVAVIGNGGSGKSTIVRHISLLLLDKYSYEITLVSSPEELRNFYKPGRKTVFVLDDLCGKFTADHTEIDHWCSMKDVVELVMEDKACKILFSCRLQVYKDEAFIDLEPFRSCACNIISEELSLTKEEKKQIFQKYLKLKNIDEDIFLRKNDMFPLLCELYSNEKEQKDVNLYFNTPYQVYLDDLDKLGRKGKHKLCGLCLCIMFNNQLKESEFLTPSVKFPQIFKEVCNYCKINEGTSPILIRDEINTLVNTYINKHDELYEIYHDKLFDFLAFYFGKKMTHCFIKHADSSFLRDRFVWKNAIDTADQSNENIVLLKDCYLKAYIERMKSDWANGKVSDVFYNINMRNQSFREEFLKLLIDVDKELATNLSNMKDTFREDFASGNTPLIISCMHGYVDLLEWLISNKADVNEQRKDGSSGLFMGCEKNHVAIVKLLLEKDADVGVCTVEGVSPLGIACYYHGNLEIISMLLVKIDDVDKHRFTKINMTPLFMACEKNFLAVAKKLLEQKANPNICLRDGMSVLLAACQKQYPNIVHLLLKYKANPNVGKYDGNTPLFSACGMGFKDIAEMLINYGADLNKCVHSRETIELKRSTKSFERLKESWLKAAKSFGSQKTKEYIQNKSADYVFDVVTGSSPLHVACYMGHYEISKLLIENLLCVDIRKQNGITPLFYACEIGHFDIVNELLKKGADQTFCRGNQRSPLEIAKLNEHVNIVELLERMGSCTS